MIDLHCHILHALDDGPKTVNESIQMAQALFRTGYRLVVATPHMVPGTRLMPSIHRINTQVMHMNQAMQLADLKLKIVSGMEIALDPQIPDMLDDGCLLPLGGSSCLLIEPSHQQFPPGWLQVIFTVLSKGYTILLAHPERCPQLAANPDLVQELIEAGVYLQVNWGSFSGLYGRTAKRAATLLAKNGWIHCLATDSHRPERPITTEIQRAAVKLGKLIGHENLRQITLLNPQNVLRNEALRPMQIAGAMSRQKSRPWRQWCSSLGGILS